MRRKLVVGNWKMHGSRAGNAELLAALVGAQPYGADVAVCVPGVFVGETATQLTGSAVAWGAQDVSAHAQGAYTGEVSASMLAEFGCRYVIVGHSERRQYHAESDELVAAKAESALAGGITPIVCVGETLEERDGARTEAVVTRQLLAVTARLGARTSEIVLAYEPVWAIGTGRTATPEQAQAVHAVLRAQLAAACASGAQMRILYGGSVKGDNARLLFAMPDIDGGLIGGASLKAAEFIAICRAAS
ncbi:MAG TPA: triose-phosphate isomerase [Rubrivivax sp.]|nr:triose-phosphate isomerase [Pseudomonadota bacterium]HOL37976.1 triose-phosphate isomerase [Rubrivivax sp.]HPP82914.1 triose-phosphate isomerase [Rubrivivax sp.]